MGKRETTKTVELTQRELDVITILALLSIFWLGLQYLRLSNADQCWIEERQDLYDEAYLSLLPFLLMLSFALFLVCIIYALLPKSLAYLFWGFWGIGYTVMGVLFFFFTLFTPDIFFVIILSFILFVGIGRSFYWDLQMPPIPFEHNIDRYYKNDFRD